jgi:4-hydroxy-tetrahydrodipicolinate synthase
MNAPNFCNKLSRVPCSWSTAQLITAMATPFSACGSLVDPQQLHQLAHQLIHTQKSDALLVNGTTGESPTLSSEEKRLIIETVLDAANSSGTPVLAGVGSNDTRRSIQQAEQVATMGVQGLLLVTPYYNRPTQRGLIEHFEAMAKAVSPMPVMLYNIPGRSAVELLPETVETLVGRCANIVGVKQSVGNLDQCSEMVRLITPYGGRLWSGDDSLTLPMMAVGAVGVVSVLSHLAGAPLKTMMQLMSEGKVGEAQTIHATYLQAMRDIFFLPNPTVIKAALAHKKLLHPSIRLPLVWPEHSELERIASMVCDLDALNQSRNNS